MSIKKVLTEGTLEQEVLDFLKNLIAGTEYDNNIYLAGGAVRDELMGKAAKDLDFVVNGDINAGINFSFWLANKLGNYKEDSNPVIYPRFGTSKLSLNNNVFNLPNIDLEFVAPRAEAYNNINSRKPDVVGGDLKVDVSRRDLTINSLLKNVSTNEILDLTGYGIDDIKNGIIRTTSNADEIFKQDGLRMLRAVRFTVKYNFKLDLDTIRVMRNNAYLLNNISNERISDELNKILLFDNPAKGIRLLKVTGLLPYIVEELIPTIGMKQNKYHINDVFGHTMSVLDNTPPVLETRLMALFHDIGKVITKTIDENGEVHFLGHEKESEVLVRSIMSRLKYSNDIIDIVACGVKNHMYLKQGGDDGNKLLDKTLRKFKATVGDNIEQVLDLIHADNISHTAEASMPNQIGILRERIDNLSSKINNSNRNLPINGSDLIGLGVKPSPFMGELLDVIQDAWYENPDLTKDEALELINKYL